jgi:hypothetical protein
MAGSPFSGGPLAQSDLLGIWKSTSDDSYTEPFINAGDGQGLEAWNQAFAQLARVSQAVDAAMSSLYILPWSGQTNAPASGPVLATVSLSISRTGLLNWPLVLAAGLFVDEVAPDWSTTGTQPITTGIRFALSTTVVFEPGDSGPISVLATAERPGFGYNNVQPGNLNVLEQDGAGYYNQSAATQNTLPTLPISQSSLGTAQLILWDEPHVLLPEHIGQYIVFTGGLNAGTIARVVSYRAPSSTGSDGGAVSLEMLVSIHASTFTGTFAVGELVKVGSSPTGYGKMVQQETVGAIVKMSFVLQCGSVAAGAVLTGISSGATATIDIVYSNASTIANTSPSLPPSTESWRVLGWTRDWGISVTNALQPSGGAAGVLDMLGAERNLPRATLESDTSYRYRVATPGDTVSPNAMKRQLNRSLTNSTLGLAWCFREIGTALFPGFFYGDGQSAGDFYDYDAVLFAGASPTGFFPNEPVTQTVNGVVSSGKALIQTAAAATILVPGQAGTTGIPGATTFLGVAGLRLGYGFVAGVPVIGTHSGASTTPTAVSGGLGFQYTGNVTTGPQLSNAWRLFVDYERMRGYFVVQVQRSGYGDFGFAWGSGAPGVGGLIGFWDTGPGWNDFYDGFPRLVSSTYLSAFHALDGIRVAGVLVEFFPLTGPCV